MLVSIAILETLSIKWFYNISFYYKCEKSALKLIIIFVTE